jgi:hypothetical protein
MQSRLPRRVSKKAVAVHEAAHVVVHACLRPGAPLGPAWLKAKRGSWIGRTEFHNAFQGLDERSTATLDEARRELVITLAGPVAEARWRGDASALADHWQRALDATATPPVASDEVTGLGISEWLALPVIAAHFEQSWREAESLVDRHWQTIVELGSLLKDRERIEGAELAELTGHLITG